MPVVYYVAKWVILLKTILTRHLMQITRDITSFLFFVPLPNRKLNSVTHFSFSHSYITPSLAKAPPHNAEFSLKWLYIGIIMLTIIHFLDEGSVLRNGWMARAEAKWT